MPDGEDNSIEFQSPQTNAVKSLPPEQWEDALKAGYKPTKHVVMYSPEGERGMVPREQVSEKQKAGYQVNPETEFETQRKNAPKSTGEALTRAVTAPLTKEFWNQAATATKNIATGVPGMLKPLMIGGGLGHSVETIKAFQEAGEAAAREDVERKQEGRSVPYQAVSAAGSMIGVPERQMAHQADIGSPEGVVGAAAPITALTLAPAAMKAARAGLATETGRAITAPVRNLTESAMNAARRFMGTQLSTEAAETARPQGAFQPALANTPTEVLQHAAKEGIDLTPFQATESRVAGKIQTAGEHGIVGGQSLETALNTQRAKFGDAVNRMSERVDPTRLGLSEELAGEAIQQSAKDAKDVSHTNASDAYKNLPLEGQTVNTTRIAAGWRQLRGGMPTGIEDQILAQVPRNMKATVAEILSPTGLKAPLPFEQAISLRSLFRELGDTIGASLPDRSQGIFRRMSDVVDSAMERSAEKGGFEKEWRTSNEGWKDYIDKYGDKKSALYKILAQKDPATITRDLTNRASAADVELLKKEGMTSALEPLRRQVLQDIARNKFTVGRDGLSGYSDAFLNQLFDVAGKKELYLKADLARRMNWEPSGTGGTLLAAEQIGKPSKIAQLFGAAKLSMPREATSFLPRQALEQAVQSANPAGRLPWSPQGTSGGASMPSAPTERFIRPAEPPPMAGRGPAPTEMHPQELAEIRKQAGRPNMTAEEAHRWRINQLAATAAGTELRNDLGGMKRAGD